MVDFHREYKEAKRKHGEKKSAGLSANVYKYLSGSGISPGIFADRVKRARASQLKLWELEKYIVDLKKQKADVAQQLNAELDAVAEASEPRRFDELVDVKLTPDGPWQRQGAETRWKGEVRIPKGECKQIGMVEGYDADTGLVEVSFYSYTDDIRTAVKKAEKAAKKAGKEWGTLNLFLPVAQCMIRPAKRYFL